MEDRMEPEVLLSFCLSLYSVYVRLKEEPEGAKAL